MTGDMLVISLNHAKLPIHEQSHPARNRGVLRRIFMTEEGIRSGWSTLLFVGFYIAATTVTDKVLSRLMQLNAHGPLAPRLVFIEEVCPLSAILIAFLMMARVERRSILLFGYGELNLNKTFDKDR
jgi:hypothetical protein